MRIFVTGGSGFLGSRMIRSLVNQEHEVIALARSTLSGERIRTLGATPFTGDLERPEQLSLPEIEAVVQSLRSINANLPEAMLSGSPRLKGSPGPQIAGGRIAIVRKSGLFAASLSFRDLPRR